MKRKILEFTMAVLLLFCAFLISKQGATVVSTSSEVVKEDAKSEKKVIVIDAGHGGHDPGKIGINGAKEKEINLSIALKLKAVLEEKGYAVILTRDQDEGLDTGKSGNKKAEDMQNRVKIITDSAPAFTISIHQNSYTQESVYGPQVFYFSHSDPSKRLAEILQNTINVGMEVERPRVAKANDNYYLLKKTSSPIVIVECGFLSNQKEANQLIQEEYQDQLVEHISQGIEDYLKEEP